MNRTGTTAWLPLGVLATALLLSACDVEVRGDHTGRDADVDIRTPAGGLTVRSNAAQPETGLPIYPGAQPLRDRDEGHRASVKINTSFFRFEVEAAEFESADPPEAIVAFYRDAMATYGAVLECRGDIDFKGRRARQRAVCDEEPRGRETQLVVGTGDNYRTIAVKPRGTGSEFSVVRINSGEGK